MAGLQRWPGHFLWREVSCSARKWSSSLQNNHCTELQLTCNLLRGQVGPQHRVGLGWPFLQNGERSKVCFDIIKWVFKIPSVVQCVRNYTTGKQILFLLVTKSYRGFQINGKEGCSMDGEINSLSCEAWGEETIWAI